MDVVETCPGYGGTKSGPLDYCDHTIYSVMITQTVDNSNYVCPLSGSTQQFMAHIKFGRVS
jgi:hypothetical protein